MGAGQNPSQTEGTWPDPKETWCSTLSIKVSGREAVAWLNIVAVAAPGDFVTLNASLEAQLQCQKTSSGECLAGERELIFQTLEKE